MTASTQAAYVRLDGIDTGIARPAGAPAVAVVRVEGTTLHLRSADRQDAALSGFAALLNTLREPVQLLVRAMPADMGPRLAAFRRAAPPELLRLADRHAAFLATLADGRALLERDYFVIVPDTLPPSGRSLRRRQARALEHAAAVRQRLSARCEAIIAGLRRCELGARRLADDELAELFYRAWQPDMSKRQHVHASLAGRAALVVGDRRARSTIVPAEDPDRVPHADAAGYVPGTRSLADLVAPGLIERHPSYLLIDGQYVRTLFFRTFPREVPLGWLGTLTDSGEAVEVAVHLRPLPSGPYLRDLTRQLADHSTGVQMALRNGQPAKEAEERQAVADVGGVLESLQLGTERVFGAGVYLTVRAPSLPLLDAATDRLYALVDGMLAHAQPAWLEQDKGLRSVLPQGTDELGVAMPLTTTAAATLFPFTSATLGMETGMLYGTTPDQALVLLDPFDPSMPNANMAIFAGSGAGKSYLIKLLALRALLAGQHVRIVDWDGEYGPLLAAVPGAQRLLLAPGSPHHLNPFDLARGQAALGDALALQIQSLLSLVGMLVSPRGSGLTPEEAAILDTALAATYRAAGVTGDPATHHHPAPVLADLSAALFELGGDAARSLRARLAPYVDGSFAGLFGAPTNVPLDGRLVVFDLSRLEPAMRPLATHLVATTLWMEARRQPRPRLVIVDEAQQLLAFPDGAAFLERLSAGARKAWLGLVVAMQQVRAVLDNPAGEAIRANAATTVLLRQEEAVLDRLAAVYHLSPAERHLLRAADRGEGLLFARGAHLHLRVVASPEEHAIATSMPSERATLDAGATGESGAVASLNGHATPALVGP